MFTFVAGMIVKANKCFISHLYNSNIKVKNKERAPLHRVIKHNFISIFEITL